MFTWKVILFNLIVWVLVYLVVFETSAQEFCAPRDSILKNLKEKYDEHPISLGVTKNGDVIELTVAEDGSTWTIMVTRTDGVSCLISSGEWWTDRRILKGKGVSNDT